MNNVIIHRGPDDDGVHLDGPVGIGMRRLSIIDLEGGHQPIANENGLIHVIQNGEIYNFKELQSQLKALGHQFRTRSDTETIVHAYEEWGGFDFANHLRGMFAIAIWDSERRELWLARDRLGIKPLYYAQTIGGLAFGSEVKSLLASPIVPHEVEPRTLTQYLTFGNTGLDGSFVKHVSQLRPGHVLRYDGSRIEVRAYWTLRHAATPRSIDEREAVELLEARLRETVRAHLVSDVPIGAFLSGGLDSSAIVGLMAEEGCTNLKTFSIGFETEEFNELPYAQVVATRWRTDHHTEIVRPDDAIAILDKLIHHLDEPFADASAIPTWYVSQLAARHVKVVLSGDGGDELFGGYTRYADISRDAWLDRIPPTIRRCGSGIAQSLPESFPGKYYLDYAAGDKRDRYLYGLALFPVMLRNKLIRPEWHVQQLGICDPIDESLQTMKQYGNRDALDECTYLDTMQYLPCDILPKVDRMTMAHHLEARPPLLDHEFVEFVASLPSDVRFGRKGGQKRLLKQAIRSVVPEELFHRKKMGFAVPLQSWFAGPLAPMLRDCVLDNGRSSEYLDIAVARMLFEENLRGRRDHGLKLWAILMLELWLRRMTRSK